MIAATRTRRTITGLVLCLSIAACATPSEHVDRLAAASGFERRVVAGDPFEHVVFVKTINRPVDGFRVYLEGDGTPWINRHRVATDPTPRRPLMLELMSLDPGPALYLGRPCYFGLSEHCTPEQWTRGRYSETVIESMAVALGNIQRQVGWQGDITLVGHSGGGTLAMLLAPRLPRTAAVITLAANLSVDDWTRLHEYSPLSGSLNPATAGPLPARIRQIHVTGGEDRNVPAWITRAGLKEQHDPQIVDFPRYDHHCCWKDVWRSILDRL